VGGLCHEATGCEGDDECSEGLECIGAVCVEAICRGAGDCEGQLVCELGECVPYEAPETLDQVIILTRPGIILPAQEIAMTAIALDDAGNVIIGAPIRWASSLTTAATIGEETGVLVGADTPGTTTITATVAGFSSDISDSVEVQNNGLPPETGIRVTVIDAVSGDPLENAEVRINGDIRTSDSRGVAEDLDAVAPFDIHVFEEDSDFVSLLGITAADVVVPLADRSQHTTMGGFTGQFDYTNVTSAGDIDVGLAGSSMAGDLINLDLATLLGDGFVTEITSPFGNFDFPLPGGFVVIITAFGVTGSKDTYQVQGREGFRFAWGLAGRLELSVLLNMFSGGGGGGTADIIGQILPFFESFEHGLQAMDIEELDRIVDAADYDNDGDTTEMIADYEEFPEIELAPDVAQTLRTELSFPTPPVIGDAATDIAIVWGGALVESVGFVPLGLSASSTEGDELPDILLKMAPLHSGLTAGGYAVMAVTFDSGGAGVGAGGFDLPTNISGVLFVGGIIPTRIDFGDDFPALPEDSTFDAETRELVIADVGATFYRVRFQGPDGDWTIFIEDPGEFELPEPPEGFPDPLEMPTIIVEALHTVDTDLDSLAEPAGATLRTLDQVVTGFGRTVIEVTPEE
jgi:hypothetical protein